MKPRPIGVICSMSLIFLSALLLLAGSPTTVSGEAPPATPAAYLPVVSSSVKGSDLVELGAPDDLAVVGEPYSSTVVAFVYHEAYTVTGFHLAEAGAPGATAPQLAAGGVITWLPTPADEGIHHFVLSADVSDGTKVERQIEIEVAPRTLLISETVSSAGATLNAEDGDYQVVIPPGALTDEGTPGQVVVSAVKRADGHARVTQAFEGFRPEAGIRYTEPLFAVDGDPVHVTAAQAEGAACGEMPFITAFNPDPAWQGGYVYSSSEKIAPYTYRVYNPIKQNMPIVQPVATFAKEIYTAKDGEGMMELRGYCHSQDQCLGKQPVIFVHGYNTFGALGGGTGTWGCAFAYVKKLGGEPFDFRWRGNTRFEDAAYALSQAIAHVTQYTGRKPLVVGHSMGGLVISTYLAGLAEVPAADGKSFVPVPYDSAAARNGRISAAVAGVVTVSSPLSGIADNAEAATYNLPRGRDVHALGWTIKVCDDFSCGESGFSNSRHTYPGYGSTEQKVKDFQRYFNVTLGMPGAHIHRLYNAWRTGAVTSTVHFDVLVSAWSLPDTPQWTNDNYWGDGLIAVSGMQVMTNHLRGPGYNYIRTTGRSLTQAEKDRAGIPPNIDYTFMLTQTASGLFGFPHGGTFASQAWVKWLPWSNPNAAAALFPQDGKIGTFDHPFKPVLDRTYAAAVALPPVFDNLPHIDLVIHGAVMEGSAGVQAAQPLAQAPVLVVFSKGGAYRGMLQVSTAQDGTFDLDLGNLLDDYGIIDRPSLAVELRIGNDTTHDAETIVLTADQLELQEVQLGAIQVPIRP
jgi:pimeloyl-ACP methyl ester carboxylesterase